MIQPTDQKVVSLKMCKCGRAPHRKAMSPNAEPPRNCHFCHKEANKKYRMTLRNLIRAVRAMEWGRKRNA